MQTVITYYKNLNRWDVKSFLLSSDIGENHIRLGSFLIKKQNQWNGVDDAPMLSLHFGGSFSQRESNQIKGKLFTANKGNLVYSKIDLRNGAIGIVPVDFPQALFTAEFPIYEIDTKIINPIYLQLYLQSEVFKKLINSIVSGASGRKRVKPSDFENLFVYIPSFDIQEKIVSNWLNAQKEAQKLKQLAIEKERAIDNYILVELGIEKKGYKKKDGAFVVRFKDLERWDLSYILRKSDQFTKSKFEIKKLKDISIDIFQGVGRKLAQNSNLILLKVKNILANGTIDFLNTEPLKECPNRKLLQEGDIVSPFIGEAIRLNKFAIFNKEPNKYAVDNNTGVIRVNKNLALPEFLRLCLSSSIGKDQIDSILIGGAVPFLGRSNAENLKIPLPPLQKQKEIAEKVEKIRTDIQKMRNTAEETLEKAKTQIGRMLEATK